MPIGKGWIIGYCLFPCLFIRLRISPARIKLAASNCARWFTGVLDRECPILGNFAPPEAQNRTIRPYTWKTGRKVQDGKSSRNNVPIKLARRVHVGSACVDIRPSPKTDVLVFVRLRISSPWIKLAASNFERAVHRRPRQGISHFVNFVPPEAQNRTNRPARPCCNVMLLGFCGYQFHAAYRCRIGVCGYTSVPEDGRTSLYCRSSQACTFS